MQELRDFPEERASTAILQRASTSKLTSSNVVNLGADLTNETHGIGLGEDRLTICVMEPHIGDWVLAASLCIVGLPLTYYTTTTPMYFGASFLFFIVMANSLIDDTYEVVLDKVKNEAAVTKMRFGRTEWIGFHLR
ncbi:hypothetical protein BASA62_001916 [Batrachochytrium salamandrivorans]|nr:hypothetical protein BASA62_001916 [Batrachochytrium salamandrivorans]